MTQSEILSQREAEVERALLQERMRLGCAEEEYAEAVALAEVKLSTQNAKRHLVNEKRAELQKHRQTLNKICGSYISGAAEFQDKCSFASFDGMASSLAREIQRVDNEIEKQRAALESFQKDGKMLQDKAAACAENFTSVAASVESTKSLIATEATLTAALMQKIESARDTFGSEAAKMKKKALEDRLLELTTHIEVSTARNEGLRNRLEKLSREGISYEKRASFKRKEIAQHQRAIEAILPDGRTQEGNTDPFYGEEVDQAQGSCPAATKGHTTCRVPEWPPHTNGWFSNATTSDSTYVVEEPVATASEIATGERKERCSDGGLRSLAADWISSTITNIEEVPPTASMQRKTHVSAGTSARCPTEQVPFEHHHASMSFQATEFPMASAYQPITRNFRSSSEECHSAKRVQTQARGNDFPGSGFVFASQHPGNQQRSEHDNQISHAINSAVRLPRPPFNSTAHTSVQRGSRELQSEDLSVKQNTSTVHFGLAKPKATMDTLFNTSSRRGIREAGVDSAFGGAAPSHIPWKGAHDSTKQGCLRRINSNTDKSPALHPQKRPILSRKKAHTCANPGPPSSKSGVSKRGGGKQQRNNSVGRVSRQGKSLISIEEVDMFGGRTH